MGKNKPFDPKGAVYQCPECNGFIIRRLHGICNAQGVEIKNPVNKPTCDNCYVEPKGCPMKKGYDKTNDPCKAWYSRTYWPEPLSYLGVLIDYE